MRDLGLLLFVALCGLVATGCNSTRDWLQETTAAAPHLSGRVAGAHRVAILDSGRDAFLSRIELVRNANTSIDVQTFILDDGRTTRLFLHELVTAARRGVRVRVLADTMFSSQNPVGAARMVCAHPGVAVRVYNPISQDLVPGSLASLGIAVAELERVNQRMHNKLMVVDGTTAICGGRNYQDHYFDEDLRLNYRDRDVAVQGPVVQQMQASFDAYWNFETASIPLENLNDVAAALAGLSDAERSWPQTRDHLTADGLLPKVDADLRSGALQLRWHEVQHVAFWADSPGKPTIDHDQQSVALRLIGAVGSADEKLVVQTPYLILTDAAIELFALVHEKGVPVRVHTNSLASTDNWPSYAHSLRQRREMVEKLGFEIFELKPRPAHHAAIVPTLADLSERSGEKHGPMLSLHAKSMVIDDELAVIGSYNLDPRSEVLNSEVLFAVWDEAFADELAAAIDRDEAPGNSWVVAPRERGMLRSAVSELFASVNDAVMATTTLDVWPIEWTSSYQLREGRDPISRFDEGFYDSYENVGNFPHVDDTPTTVLVRLTRSLTGWARRFM